jgi:hypothetical protein
MQVGHGQVQPSLSDERWEYRILLLPPGQISGSDRQVNSKGVEEYEKEFNRLGKEGWNLSHLIENNLNPVIMIFKRPSRNGG